MDLENEPTETVTIPEHVVTRVEERLPGTDFDSAGEYIAYAMGELLAHLDGDDDGSQAVDREQVEARLESLGYLD